MKVICNKIDENGVVKSSQPLPKYLSIMGYPEVSQVGQEDKAQISIFFQVFAV